MSELMEMVRNAGLGDKRTTAVEKRLESIPESMRKTYARASIGKASPREAIKAFCCECMGHVRSEIPHCTDLGCPLFHLRPYQKRTD